MGRLKTGASHLVLAALVAVMPATLVVAGSVLAKGGSHGTTACVRNAPAVVVDNNWAWGMPGSWGLAGQPLSYAIDVINYDVGCGSSTFVVSMTAPDGFTVSIPTSTINLKSSASGYVWASVTSPAAVADGDYSLGAWVVRSGTLGPAGAATNYYKVYSSDTAAPSLFWPNPGDGQTITSRSYTFTVSSSDDHEVRTMDLYLDRTLLSTTACDDVSYTCQLSYAWSTTKGQHTVTFESHDWLNNTGTLTVQFTVS